MSDAISYNVIHTWRRGSTSYMYGASNQGTRIDTWNCGTIDSNPFSACFPSNHSWGYILITKSLYDSLYDSEKAIVRARAHGMVDGSYYYTAPWTDYSGRVWQVVYLNEDALVECWTDRCFNLRPDLVCEGVVCGDTCIGADKYSSVCMLEGDNAGECAQDQLIEANSPDCPGYDPCLDVVCDPTCYGYDLYETYCAEGICEQGGLIEVDSYDCEYTDPTIFDTIIDNKEILLACIIAGVIVTSVS